MKLNHIVVSRNDAVGDIVLALPVCGLIKESYPSCKISILGRTYTKEVALASKFVDDFINSDEFDGKSNSEISCVLHNRKIDAILFLRPDRLLATHARRAGISLRIGTTNRAFHWFTCNKLVRLSRKNSPLHEAQLNLILLKGINIARELTTKEIPMYYGLTKLYPLNNEFKELLSQEKFNLIIHPKSHGNSMEWSLKNYKKLIERLDPSKFKIFISGSLKERNSLKDWAITLGDRIVNISGMMTLGQFTSFIHHADGLIAASTGPAHIAAATGIHTLGLYTDIKNKQASRWGPIGKKADYIQCTNADMDTITVDMVYNKVTGWNQ